jgi:hypothetical protein
MQAQFNAKAAAKCAIIYFHLEAALALNCACIEYTPSPTVPAATPGSTTITRPEPPVPATPGPLS